MRASAQYGLAYKGEHDAVVINPQRRSNPPSSNEPQHHSKHRQEQADSASNNDAWTFVVASMLFVPENLSGSRRRHVEKSCRARTGARRMGITKKPETYMLSKRIVALVSTQSSFVHESVAYVRRLEFCHCGKKNVDETTQETATSSKGAGGRNDERTTKQ